MHPYAFRMHNVLWLSITSICYYMTRSTISEASQVKPSIVDEVEVEVLQERLVGATIIGLLVYFNTHR